MLPKIALGNVRKSLRDFSVFFITLVFGVCAFYAFASINDQTAVINLTELQSEAVSAVMRMLSSVSVFVAVILGFLVVYANRFLVRRRKREFGIYLTLGMGRAQVAAIMVMETLAVGVAALVVGLVLGVLLSQVMMYVTANLFEATIPGFAFVFSPGAALSTLACYAAIFALSLLLNVREVSRYRLIDLINADKVSEKVKARSLPVSVVLFLVSLVLMGVAYRTLLENGVMSDKLGQATALVSVGTALFFFSVSGFLLRFLQGRPGVYLRGLNAFTLRQLNSRVNTAWVSITLVCAMLFVAICGVCTGFSVSRGISDALEKGSPYDASINAYPRGLMIAGMDDADYDLPEVNEEAASDGFDMVAAMRRKVSDWDDIVSATAQVNQYMPSGAQGGISQRWAYETTSYATDATLDEVLGQNDSRFAFVRVSQFNALRALLGEKPVELGRDECLVWSDFAPLDGFWEAFIDQHPGFEALGTTLHPRGMAHETLCNTSAASVTGVLVVPDEVLPDDLVPAMTSLDVTYSGSVDECEQRFQDACEAACGPADSRGVEAWPVCFMETRQAMADSTVGLTVVTTYLAIYIGLILLISCASVLSIQQLSAVADDVSRYRVLAELGAEPTQIRGALMVQVGVYFVFPLVVAVCHAACALTSINGLISLATGFDVSNALVATVCFVVALYGGYFLLTYQTSKAMVLRTALR
ncbi:FtsX-like permease family protein [Paratractidigestivibacter faecalis]|uniref:ABC transporter permease n=1 Tax=Paratractidigestivibacter faecalis TaxID=2292441 RepID=UPI003A9348B5